MYAFVRDVRHALRALIKRPLFSIVAGASLAIGLGVTTTLFAIVHTLLLSPVPGVANASSVVELGRGRQGSGFDSFAYPDFLDIRREVPALADAAAYRMDVIALSRGAEGVRVNGIHVSPSYFGVLGVEPSLGRFFTPDEDTGADQHPVVVLGNGLWRRLGADPAVIGTTLQLNRQTFTVVGVVPEDFRGHLFAYVPDVYLPLMQYPMMHEGVNMFESRRSSWHMALGRLAPGAEVADLDRQLAELSTRLATAYPESNETRTFSAVPLGFVPGGMRPPVRMFLTALLAMAVVILLVTCTNVAGMFLARASARERELAVRIALGSGRAPLVRAFTIEALVVFTLSGVLGIALSSVLLGMVRPDLLPLPVAVDFELRLDTRVLAFAAALTLVAGGVFGALPALMATRLDVLASLREVRASPQSSWLRRAFVAGQIGLCLVLLAAAGLFLRSLQRAAEVATGFDPAETYVASLDLGLEGYAPAEGIAFQARLLEQLRALTGVEGAALAADLPLDLGRMETVVAPEGWESPSSEQTGVQVDFNRVSDGYFETLRVPLLAGRTLNAQDGAGADPVLVVSRAFADQVWPGESPIGRRVRYEASRGPLDATVVGVVEDVKNGTITERARPFVYVPVAQDYDAATNVLVRVPGGIDRAAPQIRARILETDPTLALSPVLSLERYTSIGVLPQRIAAALTTTLGLLALLLSGLGIYGVVAHSVQQRTREIGIRMSLGARRPDVIRMVLRGGSLLALPGLAGGAMLAIGLGYLLRSLLLGLSPLDPVALGGVGTLLLLVVVAASAVPAWRASRVDPIESLRAE